MKVVEKARWPGLPGFGVESGPGLP